MPFRNIVRYRFHRGREESQDVRLPPTSLHEAFDNGTPETGHSRPNRQLTRCGPKWQAQPKRFASELARLPPRPVETSAIAATASSARIMGYLPVIVSDSGGQKPAKCISRRNWDGHARHSGLSSSPFRNSGYNNDQPAVATSSRRRGKLGYQRFSKRA